MTPFEIGIASVVCIVVMIYAGLYIPVALGLVYPPYMFFEAVLVNCESPEFMGLCCA